MTRMSYRSVAKRGAPADQVAYDSINAGAEIRAVFGNFNDCLYHVRGSVDGRLIVRTWGYVRQGWFYEVKDDLWYWAFSQNLWVVQ
ncbi:hypothetical protein LCGC14_2606600 [marine sediment metagenome]|uniref:Uncharacterized protein n=1 Tax=marine sediment metagenome TaxID=412755 RepID=A0A0F9A7E8_9ZZZZ